MANKLITKLKRRITALENAREEFAFVGAAHRSDREAIIYNYAVAQDRVSETLKEIETALGATNVR